MSDIVIRVVVDPAPAVSGSAQVGTALDGVRAKAAATGNEMDRMVKAFIAVRVAKELEHLADAFTEVQNRIRTVTTTEEEMVRVSNQLFEVAQQTRTSWGDTAATFQRVTQATHELGLSQQQVIDFTRQLNEAFIISGVSAGEQTRVTRDLLHGLDQGTLSWRQLLPIMSQAPSVARIIAEHFHVTTGELHALATAGKITGHEIIAAFSEANDSLEAGFGKTVPTIAQMMTTLRNAAEKFIGELMHGSIVVGVLGSALGFVVEHFDTFGKALVVLADVLLVKYAYEAIPAAIAATQAFTVVLLENPLFLAVAVVAGIYMFRDAIYDLVKSFIDVMRWMPVIGQAIWLFEHALSAVSAAASWLGDVLGGLGDAVSDAASAVGDFLSLSGPLTEALEEQRRVAFQASLAVIKLSLALHESTQIAQAFVAVAYVQKTNEIIAAIGLVVQLQHEIQIAQTAAAKVFATDLVDATKRAAKAADDARRAAEAWANETKQLTDEINRMRGAVSPATKANLELAEAIDAVTRAEQRHILSTAEGTKLIQARAVALALEQMAADEQINRQTSIVDLLEKEAEARAKVEAAKKKQEAKDNKAAASDANPPDHALSTVEDIQRAMDELAKTTDHTVVNAIHNVAQAFAELATTGKFNWRSLTDSILSDITSMIARMLEMKLLSLALGLFGGGGGAAAGGAIDYFASQASGTPVYGGAHADGGSVTVPGVGGADSVPMLFHLTPGERVDFTPPGMQRGAAAAGAPDVQIHNQVVISPDFVPSMMATPAGHRAMMDFVRVNARQIAQLTQG